MKHNDMQLSTGQEHARPLTHNMVQIPLTLVRDVLSDWSMPDSTTMLKQSLSAEWMLTIFLRLFD